MLKELRDAQVPRQELDRVWTSYDQRFADHQRQIDESSRRRAVSTASAISFSILRKTSSDLSVRSPGFRRRVAVAPIDIRADAIKRVVMYARESLKRRRYDSRRIVAFAPIKKLD
ncbi:MULTISPECIES: hypothetical protein [Sinorhizobium]|uniref:hypothetical protein n=1 Tax=Sinorhizobium TaxID=28105 RepID=UPI001596A797|nr:MULTISPECIES: hypothetical protein [Sinorhizobium]